MDEKELLKLYKTRVKDRTDSPGYRYAKKKEKNLAPLDRILNIFFKNNPEAIKKIEENRAILAWSEYIGKGASIHAKALRVSNHKLVILAPNPLWRQQLMLMKSSLLNRFHKDFPTLKLTDIFFVAYDKRETA